MVRDRLIWQDELPLEVAGALRYAGGIIAWCESVAGEIALSPAIRTPSGIDCATGFFS